MRCFSSRRRVTGTPRPSLIHAAPNPAPFGLQAALMPLKFTQIHESYVFVQFK